MRSERKSADDPDLTSHVNLLIGILHILAEPTAHARNRRQLVALAHVRKRLSALMASQASANAVRAEATEAITLAEKAVQLLKRDAVAASAEARKGKKGLAGLTSRISSKRLAGSAEADTEAAETLDLMRRSSTQLLEKLAQLRGQLAVNASPAPSAPVAGAPVAATDAPAGNRFFHRRASAHPAQL